MSNNFTWLFNWLLNSSAFFCTCLFIFEMGERQFLETVWSYPVLWLMQVSWIFHGASMQVSCWLHAGFANLAYWWVTSMTTPWNLHGICMEPPWNLHQSECMIKPTSVDRGTTSITHMETAWNSTSILHGTCMEPPWKLHQLEGAMQPSRLDTRNNGYLHETSMKPTSILHGTCMDTPSRKTPYNHQV